MIAHILIQKHAGEFVSRNGYAAWRGFTDLGREVDFFEWPSLRDGAIAIEPTTLFVGGVGAILHVLRKLGIATPTIEDLPVSLAEFRGRNIRHTTLGEVRKNLNADNSPVFIKPLRNPKAFRARTVASFLDLVPLAAFEDGMTVLASDVINFRSEWRFFIIAGEIVGVGWYGGSPLIFPDTQIVNRAVEAFAQFAPAAYGIDLGVTVEGRTLLVEVNDGYSLGALGIAPAIYSRILEARWTELMTSIGKARAHPR